MVQKVTLLFIQFTCLNLAIMHRQLNIPNVQKVGNEQNLALEVLSQIDFGLVWTGSKILEICKKAKCIMEKLKP